jgi:hypothetical protein
MVSAHLLMSCEIALNYTCYPIAAAASLLLYCILSNAFRPDTSIHWTRARAIGVLGLFLAPRQGATLGQLPGSRAVRILVSETIARK